MVGGVRSIRFGGVIAAMLLGAMASASADQPLPRSHFAPISTPTIEVQAFVPPYITQPAPGTPDFTNVIVPLRPGKKRTNPRYFGLTLSTPTH